MHNPQNTAELLFHLLALLTQRLSHVSKNLEKRNEIDPKSVSSWSGISRSIGEDIFNKPVDQTDFDGEVALNTKNGVPFSFSVRLLFENPTWTIKAAVSEIEEFGPTDRCSFTGVSSTNLEEIASAATAACDWITARAADFDFRRSAF